MKAQNPLDHQGIPFLKVILVAQAVKNLPAVRETQVRSLSQEDPLEKETATHSCILAWEIPWTEEPVGLQSMGSQSQTRLNDSLSGASHEVGGYRAAPSKMAYTER